MKKRILALVVVLSLLISTTGTPTYANRQIQVENVAIEDVFYIEGIDINTNKPILKPTMTVTWDDPADWEEPINLAEDKDEPDGYDIVVKNITKNSTSTFKIRKGIHQEYIDKSVDIEKFINLDTGSLYQVEVRPYHYHDVVQGTETVSVLAPSIGAVDLAFGITDLDVELITTDSSIQVIWDDLGQPDFNYRIVYAVGTYTNKQLLINNKEGEKIGLTSENVQKFYDPVSKRNKLSYTISENVYPGQVYSVMVEPTVDFFAGDSVMRNRNFPYIGACSTQIELDLYEEGNYIRLEWSVPTNFQVGKDKQDYELVESTLVQYVDGQSSNVVIFNGSSASIGYYKILKPKKETEYQIEFVYRALGVGGQSKPDIKPISNKMTYVPSELRITPNKPVVPKLFSKEILDDLKLEHDNDSAAIRTELKNEYFVPGYTYPVGSLDTLIEENNNTYHILKSNNSINFIWSAFRRLDVDPTSATFESTITDTNIYYDIWVTDSLESLAYAKKAVDDKRYGSSTPDNIIADGLQIWGYSQELNQYYNDETGEMSQIVPNKLYYIKVVAKKRTGNGVLTSEPTTVAVYFNYEGDAYAPPTITKPPLKEKESETTDVGVTVTWEESWWEITSDDLGTWVHEVWVAADGTLSATKVAGSTLVPIYSLTSEEEIEETLEDLDVDITDVISRHVDLGKDSFGTSDVKYKFYKIPYETVKSIIATKKLTNPAYDFNAYYEEIVKADKDGTKPLAWVNITPTREVEDTNKLDYRAIGLLPNTSYMVMIYPYREINGTTLYAHYPTPLVVATKPTDVVVNPDPTVPNLYTYNYTETSITVRWKYNLDFNYEVIYSTFEDITTAKPVTWTLPTNPLDPKYPVNGKYYDVVVDDLFPNTNYYFWVRAKQPANNNTSHWSNAVMGTTRDVNNPYAPKGFGIASLENMKKYGYDASVTDKYISIEWKLDIGDVPQNASKKVKQTYSYIIEVSDNPKFIDPIYIVSSDGAADVVPATVELLQKNLIMINELIPNRSYYVRAKSRIKIVGSEQGQLIEKDSNYTTTIKIITLSTGDEYDGTIDPDLEILPSEDYEMIYNKETKELEFRFRDNSVGSDGSKDNNVDQRLISNLIAQNVYVYNIDISNFEDKTILKRSVSIPYTILEAFDTNKVTLTIDAGDVLLEVPFGALASEVNEHAKSYGGVPSVRIEIKSLGKNYTKEQMINQPIRPVSDAQDVDIYVNSEKKNKAVYFTDKELEIQLMTNNKYEQFRVNRMGTVRDYQNNWNSIESTFDSESGYMSFKTAKVGVYGGYVLEDVNASLSTDKAHWSEVARKLVTSQYSIKGLSNYNANSKITEAKLINIMYNITLGKKEINLDDYISKDIMTALKSSKIKTNDSSSKAQVTREEAISMFTRAYEIINDQSIVPSNTTTNAVSKNANISSAYKASMAKAATIGLVSSLDTARPKDTITYGEVFAIWSKLIN
ncbi:MAG: hypothetical protein CVU84_06440 [Firmicutes bacterium HGW-Firmicutes-1]|nr:MAG: hypothetical protein CVU84_06440 [Firmicutes bacterium HGW-Firmicutes-1]